MRVLENHKVYRRGEGLYRQDFILKLGPRLQPTSTLESVRYIILQAIRDALTGVVVLKLVIPRHLYPATQI